MNPQTPSPSTNIANAPVQPVARRLVLSFVVTLLTGLTGIAGLNVLADPYGAFGVELVSADSRSGDSRTARAELLRRFTGETVLIGSSRTRVGYDGCLACVPGGPACNVGLDGTHLQELQLVVGEAVRNPHVRRIVLSLDMHLCDSRWRPNADYRCSRFNPERSSLEHACDLLWNGRTIEASLRVIRNAVRGRVHLHDEYGFARGAASKFESAPQSVRTEAALRQLCGPDGLLSSRQPREETRSQLAAMFSLCRQREIELIVVIDPVHAQLLEGIRQRGDWADYQEWKCDLVELATAERATFWDFSGYSPWTTEPLLGADDSPSRWFWEPSHMRRELGDLVLQRIFHDRAADANFGVELTSARLEKHFASTESARLDWLAGHRQEVEALASLLQPRPPSTAVQTAVESGVTRR